MRQRHYGSGVLDSEVVAAIVAGDPEGLAEAYDRYAAALYAYCRRMLREPADAADAVQDTFVIAASRLSGLRDPERLRSWLYAVARNECFRRLRGSGEQAPLEEALDVTDDAVDVSAGAERAELRDLVRRAMTGLGPAEREVLQLQLYQGLDSSEIAGVLAISRNHAHALLSRARDQLETALGVLVVARAGRRGCPTLDALLKDWDGQLTVLLRKRVGRHIERCPACSERRRRDMAPAMFLGALPIAMLPLAPGVLPAGLRSQVLHAAAGHSHLARAGYPFGHHGFPKPLQPARAPWWHPRPVHAGVAAGTAAAVTFAVMVSTPSHRAPPLTRGGTPTVGSVASGPGPGASSAGTTAKPRPGGPVRPSGAVPPSHPPASPTAARTSPATSPSASATAPTTPVPPPAAGTLHVSPTTLDVTPPAAGTITLRASGGPVDWTVREPPGLTKKVVVSPRSGVLAAGARTAVTVTVTGPGKPHVHLVFSPGGTTVTVVVG
jgi:RNA polymerase sigma factor (sigma-70 family)